MLSEREARFLELASHEFRTPLTTLRGLAQLLLKRAEHHPEVTLADASEALQVMEQDATRMARLLDRVIAAAWLGERTLPMQIQECDCVLIIRDALRQVCLSDPARPVRLDLPDSAIIDADPLNLEHSLLNLLENAFQYSTAGTMISVTLSLDHDAGRAIIRIINEAKPIPPENRERLFDRFFSISSETRIGGMGLGLYNSRQIALEHGGNLACVDADEPGHVCFMMELPIHRPSILPR